MLLFLFTLLGIDYVLRAIDNCQTAKPRDIWTAHFVTIFSIFFLLLIWRFHWNMLLVFDNFSLPVSKLFDNLPHHRHHLDAKLSDEWHFQLFHVSVIIYVWFLTPPLPPFSPPLSPLPPFHFIVDISCVLIQQAHVWGSERQFGG